MLISEQERFLFVHIQKTGGSSIRKVLLAHIPDLHVFLGTHDSARQAQAILNHEYDSYFKAAFVRNPWSRLVSWYTMIVQQSHRMSRWERLFRRTPYLLTWQYVHENSTCFGDFVRNCTADIHDRDGVKNFFRNQVDYITDDQGDRIVDFVGRYEDLSRDADQLFGRLKLTGARLPHVNASSHKHYSSYYTEETAEIVRTRYARDIETFGYEFEPDEPWQAP
jgi:hypothetical protein